MTDGGDDNPEPYLIRDDGLIDWWLGTKPPDYAAHRVRFWFRRLAADPFKIDRIQGAVGLGLPRHIAIVPDTDVQITWVVLKGSTYGEKERCVWIVDICAAPPRDPSPQQTFPTE